MEDLKFSKLYPGNIIKIILLRKSPLGADINFESLSGMTENLTGADLAHLLTSAALNAIIKKQNIINH